MGAPCTAIRAKDGLCLPEAATVLTLRYGVVQLLNTSFNLFPQELTVSGLDSTVTLTSVVPVNGYTLEAQMRQLNGLPVINVEPVVARFVRGRKLSLDAYATSTVTSKNIAAIRAACAPNDCELQRG